MMAAGALGVTVAGLSHCGNFEAKGAANRGKPLSAAAADCAGSGSIRGLACTTPIGAFGSWQADGSAIGVIRC
jgi:hypothetical protein